MVQTRSKQGVHGFGPRDWAGTGRDQFEIIKPEGTTGASTYAPILASQIQNSRCESARQIQAPLNIQTTTGRDQFEIVNGTSLR